MTDMVMMMAKKLTKRVTEYFEDPLDGEQVEEYFTDPKQDEPKQVTDNFSEDEKNEIRPDALEDIHNIKWLDDKKPLHFTEWTGEVNDNEVKCYGCKKKATEARQVFEKFVQQQIHTLMKKATEAQNVDLLLSNPTITGQKIEGVLAYAGVSLNNRLYLPEELAKGDGMRVPLIINHADVAGAEEELYRQNRVPPEIVQALEKGEEINVGYINLHWDADQNVLFYDGVIEDEFWIKEAMEGNMAVSLGMYYDADSPQYCPTGTCYTIIKNGEFHEVSLVWHPGFAIATMEAVEVRLKKNAYELLGKIKLDNNTEIGWEKADSEDLGKINGISFKIGDNDTHEFIVNGETWHKVTGKSIEKITVDEAVGPHSREYDYIINEPSTTPEITGSNATNYSKPPSTRVANQRMNDNLKPSTLNPLKDVEWDEEPEV